MSAVDQHSPPPPNENEERWRIPTSLILRAVSAARPHVGIDEATFRRHTFHGSPRAFFLWTALDEVFKTAVFLMKLDGFLGEEGSFPRVHPDDGEPTDRAIEALLLEEEGLRARRLCELLAQLVLFARKDTAELYKHFLLLDALV